MRLFKRLIPAQARGPIRDKVPNVPVERRIQKRRPENKEAICIPDEANPKRALVLGVTWTPHLTGDALFSAASKQARTNGCSHVYTRVKGDFFGIVNIDEKDVKSFKDMVPLAVAFAKAVNDKNTRSLYVLDMREEGDVDGDVYVTVALRGNPISEQICSGSSYKGLIARLSNESATGLNIYVDTPNREEYAQIAADYPSTTAKPLNQIKIDPFDSVQRPPTVNISKSHLLLVGAAAIGVAIYVYGIDFYQQNVQAKTQQEVQQNAVATYISMRTQEFQAGYAATPSNGLDGALAMIKQMPLMRNGWAFDTAKCDLKESICRIEWKRVYGTYDTFIESASLESTTIDPADFKSLSEQRPIKIVQDGKPNFDALPQVESFLRNNGDRADTFSLGGIDDFIVSPMKELVAWKGQGMPPAPVVSVATWSLTATIELVEEVVANRRLGDEFGISKITASKKDGEIYLQIEGNVYARKS